MRAAAIRTLLLQWPGTVEPARVLDATRALAVSGGQPILLEARSDGHGLVEHTVQVPEARAAALTSQLRAAIPGLGVEGRASESSAFTHAVDLRLSTRHRPLMVEEQEAISRSLLVALARVGKAESLCLQWWLMQRLQPVPVGSKAPISTASWTSSLLQAPFGLPDMIDGEARQALRVKRMHHGWQAVGRIAVTAATTSRARQLVGGVIDALRTAEAPGVQIATKLIGDPNKPPRRAKLRLNISELAAVASWPIGRTSELPVQRLGTRRLPAPHAIARTGRVIGESTWPGKTRNLALTEDDSTRHVAAFGPTGTGKSTTLLNLITQDMAAGRGVVAVEPGGDLIREVLARVPKHRINDVVLMDPTDDTAAVGLNPLSGDPADAELRADQLLSTFHNLYAANWGPRTSDILHAALLTLARTPDMSLAALPVLLSDVRFRRHLVGSLDDPLGLGPFWAQYEAWSDAERTTATAPVLNKLRPFLVRARLRRIIGQAKPKFDLRSVFSERRILLVNLARGELGAEAADLLGSLLLSGLWQQAQARSKLPASERHMVGIFLDEFPTYLHLPIDLGDALARGRAVGLSFTLVAQHLGQMDERMKSAVLANARSQICWQLAPKDAAVMAATSTLLGTEDFTSLDRFHFYARLMGEGAVQPWCSGISLPPPKATTNADLVRTRSLQRFAVPVDEVDASLRALFQPTKSAEAKASDFAPRRRKKGGDE